MFRLQHHHTSTILLYNLDVASRDVMDLRNEHMYRGRINTLLYERKYEECLEFCNRVLASNWQLPDDLRRLCTSAIAGMTAGYYNDFGTQTSARHSGFIYGAIDSGSRVDVQMMHSGPFDGMVMHGHPTFLRSSSAAQSFFEQQATAGNTHFYPETFTLQPLLKQPAGVDMVDSWAMNGATIGYIDSYQETMNRGMTQRPQTSLEMTSSGPSIKATMGNSELYPETNYSVTLPNPPAGTEMVASGSSSRMKNTDICQLPIRPVMNQRQPFNLERVTLGPNTRATMEHNSISQLQSSAAFNPTSSHYQSPKRVSTPTFGNAGQIDPMDMGKSYGEGINAAFMMEVEDLFRAGSVDVMQSLGHTEDLGKETQYGGLEAETHSISISNKTSLPVAEVPGVLSSRRPLQATHTFFDRVAKRPPQTTGHTPDVTDSLAPTLGGGLGGRPGAYSDMMWFGHSPSVCMEPSVSSSHL